MLNLHHAKLGIEPHVVKQVTAAQPIQIIHTWSENATTVTTTPWKINIK